MVLSWSLTFLPSRPVAVPLLHTTSVSWSLSSEDSEARGRGESLWAAKQNSQLLWLSGAAVGQLSQCCTATPATGCPAKLHRAWTAGLSFCQGNCVAASLYCISVPGSCGHFSAGLHVHTCRCLSCDPVAPCLHTLYIYTVCSSRGFPVNFLGVCQVFLVCVFQCRTHLQTLNMVNICLMWAVVLEVYKTFFMLPAHE